MTYAMSRAEREQFLAKPHVAWSASWRRAHR